MLCSGLKEKRIKWGTTKKGESGSQKNVQYNMASHGTHDLSFSISGADENDDFYFGLERFQTDGMSAMTHNDEKDRYRNNSLVANYGRQFSDQIKFKSNISCLLYTSPSPRD